MKWERRHETRREKVIINAWLDATGRQSIGVNLTPCEFANLLTEQVDPRYARKFFKSESVARDYIFEVANQARELAEVI